MSTFWQAVQRGARSAGPTPRPRRTGGRPAAGRVVCRQRRAATAPQDRNAFGLLAGCHVIQRERPQPLPAMSDPQPPAPGGSGLLEGQANGLRSSCLPRLLGCLLGSPATPTRAG